MKLSPLTGLVVSGLMVFSHAAVYAEQTEVGLGYFSFSRDSGDSTAIYVQGRYFLEPVSRGDSPWYEADFLSHKSSVMGAIGQVTLSSGPSEDDGPMMLVSYRHVVPGSLVTIGLEYKSLELEESGVTLETSGFELSGGKYLKPTMWVGASYESLTTSLTGFNDTDATEFGLHYKNILTVQGTKSVNVEAMLASLSLESGTTKDSNTIIEVGGDYYIDQKTGIGGSFNINSGDNLSSEGNTIEVRATMYFTPKIHGELRYESFSASDTTAGENESGFELVVVSEF
ncbi:MAG: hypothetical protein OEZ68_01195 [Gammaproteobacteria bacterium]|nr:hypothetical protein [Gammaproteobacteria bacterium]MDH5799395.1 hypothetical protein [Gammaproteobacteria bacterium]